MAETKTKTAEVMKHEMIEEIEIMDDNVRLEDEYNHFFGTDVTVVDEE